jgi:hypothetical protein
MKQPMQQLDRLMQESSRGASLEWTAPRGPLAGLDSVRIDMGHVEKLFPFVRDDASIGDVAGEWSVKVVPNWDYNFVVDSLFLTVI